MCASRKAPRHRTHDEQRRSRNVALIYDARSAYDSKVMAGIAAYLQEAPSWNVFIEENALNDQKLPSLRTWSGDGIIANFDHPRVASAVVRSRLPAVGFGSGYGWYPPASEIPYFYTNNSSIAEQAVDHLTSKGLRHFAFCGYPETRINGWSFERQNAFKVALASRGYSCEVFSPTASSERKWVGLQGAIGAWLRSLPKPVGILAANDFRGRQILECCRECRIHVPDEVAVLGVDNDELLCNLSSPVLSSIEQGAKRLGYEAASLLDRLMHSKHASRARQQVIDPVGVITRASTDLLAIEEPILARAMRFLTQNATERISVQDVVDVAGVSRSGLEKKFRAELGISIGATIRRFQLERAKQLVIGTNTPLKEIAINLHFPSVQHLTTQYRRAFGHPPGIMRRMLAPERIMSR